MHLELLVAGQTLRILRIAAVLFLGSLVCASSREIPYCMARGQCMDRTEVEAPDLRGERSILLARQADSV